MDAFQEFRVSEACFAGTTGYGYDDLGRETLDKVWARVFGAEKALVRINFVNGTHAIASALFAALRPGDTLMSVMGAPYDTLRTAIGVDGDAFGSLSFYGVNYAQVDTLDGGPDYEGIRRACAGLRPDCRAHTALARLRRAPRADRGGDRRDCPHGQVRLAGHRLRRRQLLRRIHGHRRAHDGRRGFDSRLAHKEPRRRPRAHGRLHSRQGGAGGQGGQPPHRPRHRRRVRLHAGQQPRALPGPLHGPAHHGPGPQDRRALRRHARRARLQDRARPHGEAQRHHSDDHARDAREPQALLQGHTVRLARGQLCHPRALGYARLRRTRSSWPPGPLSRAAP